MLDFNGKIEYYALDRIEGDLAVLIADDESRREVPLRQLSAGQRKEGNVYYYKKGRYVFDERETQRRLEEIRQKFKQYIRKEPRS